MNLSAWALRRPVPVALLFGLLVISGLLGFRFMPIQYFPDMDLPVIYVAAQMDGAAPAQLETEVARKIEDQLASVNKLDHINTTITDGAVSIMAIFEFEKDPETALNEVRNAVDTARQDLPADLGAVSISRMTHQEDVLATFAVSSGSLDETELSWLVDDKLSKALLDVKGVAGLQRFGGVDREVCVNLRPQQLAALGITASEVSRQLRSKASDYSGGRLELGSRLEGLRTLGALHSVEEVAALPISLPGGTRTRLDNIADVIDDHADRSSLAFQDGKPVIALQIKRANGYSDLDVLYGARSALQLFSENHSSIHITESYSMIGQTVENYDESMRMLYEGAFITVIVVWLFLRKWRPTLISALALPLSILPAFAVMYLTGCTLNVISLLAMSLVVGVLVDDAIVEIENISRHAQMGKSPKEAALEAANEIGLAVVATSLTLVAVFLPTAFMRGIMGKVFSQFGVTASAAVLSSLLVARMITPLMAASWMKPEPAPKAQEDGFVMRYYLRVAHFCMRHRWLTAGSTLAFIIGSLALFGLLGTDFVPASDASQTRAILTLPPGSTIDDTGRMAQCAVEIVSHIPEVTSVFTEVGSIAGQQGVPDLEALNSATLTVTLLPIDRRDRGQRDIDEEIRQELNLLPGVRVDVGDSMSNSLDITLASNDAQALQSSAAALEHQLRGLKGIGNVHSSAALETPEVQITPHFGEMAALGVSTEDIALAGRIATTGDYSQSLPKLNLPERQVPIRVQLDPTLRSDLDTVSLLRVPGARGMVQLGAVADVDVGGGPTTINRADRERELTISVELNGRSMGEVMNEAMELPAMQNLPPSVHLSEQGGMQDMNDMFTSFGISMLIAILCVYSLLVLLFHDFMQPLTILMAMPLSWGGALLPLVLTGTSFSMAGAIGMLMLMGITTKNSILLVEYAIMARGRGLSRLEALIDACHKRARPILMTTVAMCGGMLPIVVGLAGGDSSFRRPMALIVIGGLVSSTFFSLVVIPVIFTFVDDAESLLRRLLRLGQRDDAASLNSGSSLKAAST